MKAKYYNLVTTAHSVANSLATLTATSAPPALLAARTALDNMLEEITTTAAQQEETLIGATRHRDKVFEAATSATHVLARLLVGHALAQGDEALRAQVDYSRTDLRQGRLGRRVQRLRRVLDAAQARVPELADTGLTPALLAEAEGKLAAAEAVIASPRDHIADRRSHTEKIRVLAAKLERLLNYTLDPLMDALRASEPDTYVRYRTARRVIRRPGQVAPEARDDGNAPLAKPAAAQPLAA